MSGVITTLPFAASAAMDIEIGEYLLMGTYYGEPILWRCIDIDEKGPLMLSDKILCMKAFDASGYDTSGSHARGYKLGDVKGYFRKEKGSNYWADSNIRSWLNSAASAGNVEWLCGNPPDENHVYINVYQNGYNEYDQEAGFLTNFTQKECAAMKTVTLQTEIDPYEYSPDEYNSYEPYNYENSSETMFLLDDKKVEEIKDNGDVLGEAYYIGKPTEQALFYSEYIDPSWSSENSIRYWLRNPANTTNSHSHTRFVESNGDVDYASSYYTCFGIRPAFYLNLSSADISEGEGTEASPYTLVGGVKKSNIILSKDNISATPYTCENICVFNADGTTPYNKSFKVKSSNAGVVSSSKKGNEIILSFNSIGNATITVESVDGSNEKAVCYVTVGEEDSDAYLLKRFALSQIIYSNGLEVYSEEKDNTVGKQSGNRYNNMFYLSTAKTVKWNQLYKQYINDYKIVKLPENPRDGFYAAAFESPEGEIIIAYRGTENGTDKWTDAQMVFDHLDDQFADALDFYDEVEAEFSDKKITLTGHSLGGALASYVAINRGVRCDNINGATGWLLTNDIITDSDKSMLSYKGFDKYVFENFNEHNDLLKIFGNYSITQLAKKGAYNYNKYADSQNYNIKDTELKPVSAYPLTGFYYDEVEVLKRDYHSISSIINYRDDGRFEVTDTTEQYIVDDYKVIDGNIFLGTSKSDNIKKKNSSSGFFVSKSAFVLCGEGSDTVEFVNGGDDTIIGNDGDDYLNGGSGNDLYVFSGKWGNDIISDPSGDDIIQLADAGYGDYSITYSDDYVEISCNGNTININTSIRKKNLTVIDEDGDATTITCGSARLFSLRAVNDTSKGIIIEGNAVVEIYDATESLIDAVVLNDETEESIEYCDYGVKNMSPNSLELILPPDGYIIKVSSDENIGVWTVSDADNPTVAKQTFIENLDLSDGSILVINTGEMVEEQLSVELLKGEETESIYSEAPDSFNITADKTEIKIGETITMSVPGFFADAATWKSSNGNVAITQNEDKSVSVTGCKAGEETVKAYLTNDELYVAEVTFKITEDSAPNVIVKANDEVYDGSKITKDEVLFEVELKDGYDKVVFSTTSPFSHIEDTNKFIVNEAGTHSVSIYCENTQTGALTKAFKFEFVQDGEVPIINGIEDGAVYYTDRIVEVYDTELDTIYVNDELIEDETFVISEVGNYTITVNDTVGNATNVSFEIKAMPIATDIIRSDLEMVSKIRNDFEEVKYYLTEERIEELETKISGLEEEIYIPKKIEILPPEGNGVSSEGGEYYKGEFIDIVATPFENEEFLGWYNGETLISSETTYHFQVMQPIALTAKFTENTCEVIFVDEEDNVVAKQRIKKGNTIIIPEAPLKEGYTFEGFYKDEEYTIKVNADDVYDADTTNYAKYIKLKTEDGIWYTVDDEVVKVLGYEGEETSVVIPKSIAEYPVKKIANHAFAGKNIETILIPVSITEIAEDVFENCESLAEIQYMGSEEQWQKIDIAEKNTVLNGMNTRFNCFTDFVLAEISDINYQAGILVLDIAFNNAENDFVLHILTDDRAGMNKYELAKEEIEKGTESVELSIPFIPDEKSHNLYLQYEIDEDVYEYEENIKSFYAEKTLVGTEYDEIYYVMLDDERAEVTGSNTLYLEIPPIVDGHKVVSIAENAFYNSDIRSVLLPITLENIGKNAFYNCSDLESINYAGSSEKWQEVAIEEGNTIISESIKYDYPDSIWMDWGWYQFNVDKWEIPLTFYRMYRECSLLVQIYEYDINTDSLAEKIYEEYHDIPLGITDYQVSIPFPADNKRYSIVPTLVDKNDHNVILMEYNGNGFLTAEREVFQEDGWRYYCYDGISEIAGYDGEIADVLTIPAELGGCPVTKIVEWALYIPPEMAPNLEKLVIPSTVTHIGREAFGMMPIKEVVIPASVCEFGQSPFVGCDNLTNIIVDEANDYYTSIDGNLYTKDKKKLVQYALGNCSSEIVVSEGTEIIGEGVFAMNEKIEKVKLPSSIKELEPYAFTYCSNLKDIEVDNTSNITKIGRGAFQGTAFEKFEIPASVTFIGEGAFDGCDNLTSIEVESDNNVYCSVNGNLYSKDKKTFVLYANGKQDTYFEIPDTIKEIVDGAFNSASIERIFIPKSVTAIGVNAFGYNMQGGIICYEGSQEEWNDFIDYDNASMFVSNSEKIFDFNKTATVKGNLLECYYDNGYVTAHVKMDYVFEDCAAILAVYDKDERLFSMTSVDLSKESQYIDIPCKVNEDCEDYTAKVFFWKNFASIKPLAEPIIANITEPNLELASPYEEGVVYGFYQYNEECESISLTFSEDTVIGDSNVMEIFGLNDEFVGQYYSGDLSGQTITVPGNKVKIAFWAGQDDGNGYKVTNIVVNK